MVYIIAASNPPKPIDAQIVKVATTGIQVPKVEKEDPDIGDSAEE